MHNLYQTVKNTCSWKENKRQTYLLLVRLLEPAIHQRSWSRIKLAQAIKKRYAISEFSADSCNLEWLLSCWNKKLDDPQVSMQHHSLMDLPYLTYCLIEEYICRVSHSQVSTDPNFEIVVWCFEMSLHHHWWSFCAITSFAVFPSNSWNSSLLSTKPCWRDKC